MVNLKQFNEYLKLKNYKFSHWSLPKTEFRLVEISEDKFFLEIYKDGELLYPNSDDFNFQIHYGEKECLMGLFVKSKDRGWFLAEEDILEATNIGIGIVAMFRNRMDMMKEIYERETTVAIG